MFENIQIFRMAQAMAVHAGTRQNVIAENIAHADTPGYVARDIAPFTQVLQGQAPFALRSTRPAHLRPSAQPVAYRPRSVEASADPNGNSVSLETEMVKATEVKRQHDKALAIYKNTLDILRSALGERR